MLQIAKDKLKTNGILIPEIIYIRTIQSTGVGVIASDNPDNIELKLQGIAWLKSTYDIDSINAVKLPLDELKNTFNSSMPAIDAATGVNYQYFNEIYKQIIIDTLGLVDADISVIAM